LVGARCEEIIGISHAVTRTFGRSTSKRVRVVPCGIPEYRFEKEAARLLVLDVTGSSAQDRVVLHVGRLFPAKGQRDLLEVAPRILEVIPAARFVFVAAGVHDAHERAFAQSLVRRAGQLGISDSVLLLEDHPEAVRLMAGADLVAVPSLRDPVSGWREGFGLVGVEAMSVGTPVVGYADGALPEVLGDCAELVTPGDRSALRQAIIRLLTDEGLRDRSARCGLQRARHYSLANAIRSMEQCYRQVANRAR
jgi:glycosyltransferase involved in cell wall biosynthesis